MAFTRELEIKRADFVREKYPYQMQFWSDFDYSALNNVMCRTKKGGNMKYYTKVTYNDIIIGADTETSRIPSKKIPCVNIVVAWTISLRAYHFNWVTLYGTRPSEMAECLEQILLNMSGDKTYIYFHNLAYDWVFLRKFLFERFGTPKKEINTKPHYPIHIEFNNGLTIRDSLILAQVKLEKWAADLGVEHQKAVGFWDYEKLRTQSAHFNKQELIYIEQDTLALVECLDSIITALDTNIASVPLTATGILRKEIREKGRANGARDKYLRQKMSYEQYIKCNKVFHGGFCHGNRYRLNQVVYGDIRCYDFTSSYPFVMLAFKYPMEKFTPLPGAIDPKYILKTGDKYAYMFRLDLVNVRLKDPFFPMPVLSFSKCSHELCVNAIQDNGRITSADMISVYCNEQDLYLINYLYYFDQAQCCEVEFARKDYLPRWFTDHIFELFKAKQALKGIPERKVNYNLSKAKINAGYGLTVQRNIVEDLIEDFITGEYHGSFELDPDDPERDTPEKIEQLKRKKYEEYIGKSGTILPYSWGCWVCSYAQRNLFLLGECIRKPEGSPISNWIYSDTDSIYASDWDIEMVDAYNELCKKLLKKNGYGAAVVNGKEYWLGVATTSEEDVYTEFKTLGAKRYCGRCKEDGELHITISGVPKKASKVLKDNINLFRPGFVFPGVDTGKLTHYYIYQEEIHIRNGQEIGDSIDLRPCDYELDMGKVDWNKLKDKEVMIQIYGEEE